MRRRTPGELRSPGDPTQRRHVGYRADVLRATAIVGLSGLFLALSAGSAAALEPQPPEDISSLSAAEAILLFVGVPLLVIAVITALVLLPGTRGAGAAEERGAEAADEYGVDASADGPTWINPGGDQPATASESTGGRGARW